MKECKDAHYICNALVGYIEIIRVHNIIQISIYNASNMQNVVDFFYMSFSKGVGYLTCTTNNRNHYFIVWILDYKNIIELLKNLKN